MEIARPTPTARPRPAVPSGPQPSRSCAVRSHPHVTAARLDALDSLYARAGVGRRLRASHRYRTAMDVPTRTTSSWCCCVPVLAVIGWRLKPIAAGLAAVALLALARHRAAFRGDRALRGLRTPVTCCRCCSILSRLSRRDHVDETLIFIATGAPTSWDLIRARRLSGTPLRRGADLDRSRPWAPPASSLTRWCRSHLLGRRSGRIPISSLRGHVVLLLLTALLYRSPARAAAPRR